MDIDREFSRLVAIELVSEGKRRGVTQKQIAAAAGIGAPQLSYYVAGVRGLLTVGTLVRAAERLGINPETIVERAYAALTEMSKADVMLAASDADIDAEVEAQQEEP